jgi:hypothetical protein
MPRVPSYQPNQAGPVQTTNARFRAPDNPGGLSVLAEGFAGAAKFAGTADKFEFDNDEAQQRWVLAEARLVYTGKGEDFSTLRLSDARDGEKDFVRDLDKIKDGFLQQARSPRARQMISEGLMQIDGETRLRLTQHATAEARAEQKASFGFEQSAIVDNAVTIGLENPAAKDRLGLQLRDSVRNQLNFEGYDEKTNPQIFAQAEKVAVSKIHQGIVDRMFSDPDPQTDEIIAYRSAYQDEMTLDLQSDIMRRLQGPLQARLATSDTAAILSIYQGEAPEKAANAGTSTSYLDRVRRQESGGSDTAKNPRSSATGRYQFTDGTWLASYRKRYGGGSMSDHQILAKRGDGEIQEQLMQDLTNENGKVLQDAGLPVNGGTLYLAHFAGAAGAKQVLKADPGASVASVLGAKVVAANPFLKNWTAGALIDWAGGVGGADPVANAPVERDPVQLNAAIEKWAKATGASPERVQRARQAVQAHARTDEGLLKARQQDAAEKAKVIALQMGDNFKFASIPKAVRDNLAPIDGAELQAGERRIAEARTKADAAARGLSEAWHLEAQARFDPEGFKGVDLKKYIGVLGGEALNSLATRQLELIRKPRESYSEINYRGNISSEIAFQEKHNGVKMNDAEKVQMFDYMSGMLSQVYAKKGQVTKQDVSAMFQSGYREVAGTGGLLSSDKRQFEVLTDIPDDFKQRFVAAWPDRVPPTNAEMVSAYQQWLNEGRR